MKRNNNQVGAITPVAAVAALLLTTVVMGAFGIGRTATARGDLRRAADAAVLSATAWVRERGLPFTASGQATAERIARGNSGDALDFQWNVRRTSDGTEISVAVHHDQAVPRFVFGRASDITISATSVVPEQGVRDVERRVPKLMLVLDYSGSMLGSIDTGLFPTATPGCNAVNCFEVEPGPQTEQPERKIDRLEASVTALLNADLDMEIGAVLYDDDVGVFRPTRVAIGANSRAGIQAAMDNREAAGGTPTGSALQAGFDLLRNTEDTGRYVLLVSDGAPNPDQDGRGVADAMRRAGITIFTLEIRAGNAVPELAQNMLALGGTASSPSHPAFAFVAETADEITQQFENILAEILCRAGPLTGEAIDYRIFLARDDEEQRLEPCEGDVIDFPEQICYAADGGFISLTEAACSLVIDEGFGLLARNESPRLTQ